MYCPGPQASGQASEMGAQDNLEPVSQSPRALTTGAHMPDPGHKAVNLSPVPASMNYKLQRSIWAWSPEPWVAGGYDSGYKVKSSPASVSPFMFPHLVQC